MEAAQEELAVGHAGNDEAEAEDMEGLLTKVTWPYCETRLLKSWFGVTVVPSEEMLTNPKFPAELFAGKYEKAKPPDLKDRVRMKPYRGVNRTIC